MWLWAVTIKGPTALDQQILRWHPMCDVMKHYFYEKFKFIHS